MRERKLELMTPMMAMTGAGGGGGWLPDEEATILGTRAGVSVAPAP